MDKVHSNYFSCQKCPFSVFLTGVPSVRIYSVKSVERSHLVD